jgi:uncharacterized protein involved in cysteine biosynthesis
MDWFQALRAGYWKCLIMPLIVLSLLVAVIGWAAWKLMDQWHWWYVPAGILVVAWLYFLEYRSEAKRKR